MDRQPLPTHAVKIPPTLPSSLLAMMITYYLTIVLSCIYRGGYLHQGDFPVRIVKTQNFRAGKMGIMKGGNNIVDRWVIIVLGDRYEYR